LWKLRLSASKEVLDTLESISSLSFPSGKPPLIVMDNLIAGKHSPELLEDELLMHIFHPHLSVYSSFLSCLGFDRTYCVFRKENFTTKFYAEKFLEHVRIHATQRRWRQVESLMHGAVLISQWGLMEEQHLTTYGFVDQILANIADRAQQIVDAEEDLNNPDTSTNKMPKTAKEILNCINQVLYRELGFQKYILHKNSTNFTTVVFCIEKVFLIHLFCSILLTFNLKSRFLR
jgi:hypothetical protein